MKFTCALLLVLVVLFFSPAAYPQSTSATLSGVVLDPAGKAIPDAELTILNEATGIQYEGKTNGVGLYTIPILPPGQYRMQVSKNGFKTLIKAGIVLNVQSAVELNFTMPVGAASESITVEAGSSRLNTTDASVSTVIDRKFVENIPLNGRSFQDLISMTPGVVTQSPQSTPQSPGNNGDFSVNGQRTESNYYTVDGVAGNTSAGSATGYAQPATGGTIGSTTAMGTTQSLIPVDALQEFRVQSSTYSAEFGTSPGGQFSLATRSGTNKLHGSAFDYLRNNFFDANDWFNDLNGKAMTPLRQNDFGGTLGGPLFLPRIYDGKDKTLFFAYYEGLRLTQPQAATVLYVPDTYMRQQAPAALQAILNAYPMQNGIDYGSPSSPSFAQFIQPYSLPSQIDSGGIRLDHTFDPELIVFVRFSTTPSSTSTRTLSQVNRTEASTQTYMVGATSQFNKAVTNELRVGYASSKALLTSALDTFGGAIPTNLAQDMGLGSYSAPYANFYIDLAAYGSSSITTEQASNRDYQWNAIDNLSITLGHHQVKTGINYRRITSPLTPASPEVFAYFFSSQAVLSNQTSDLYAYKYGSSTPVFNDWAAFLQDEWHVKPTLTVSLGVRWEIAPPPSEANGNDAYTLLGNIGTPSTLTLAPQGTPLWHTTYHNLAPRLGVAWIAHNTENWQTVVRTGGGVFYDNDNELGTKGFSGLGFSGDRVYSGVPAAVTPAQLAFSLAPTAPYTGSIVYAFPSHLQLPYTLEWNAAVEQGLGRAQTVTFTYVGANGRRQVYAEELSVTSLNPNFGTIEYFPGGVTSNYQALQTAYQRSVSHGIQAIASYTWAHSIDLASTALSLPIKRGNSDFDVRHNFQGGISWEIPAMRAHRVIRAISSKWGIDGRFLARTAFPVNIQGNFLLNPDGSYYYSGVNIVPGQPVYLYGNHCSNLPGSRCPGGKAINPGAFTKQGVTIGDAPRNFIRGFGESQINLAARREFHLCDNFALQFRAEAFNVFNHPNFGYVNATLGQATFGEATNMLNQSLGTMASQYQQGGPRSMQFAMRLSF